VSLVWQEVEEMYEEANRLVYANERLEEQIVGIQAENHALRQEVERLKAGEWTQDELIALFVMPGGANKPVRLIIGRDKVSEKCSEQASEIEQLKEELTVLRGLKVMT
jgi:hypothetical protein